MVASGGEHHNKGGRHISANYITQFFAIWMAMQRHSINFNASPAKPIMNYFFQILTPGTMEMDRSTVT